VSNVDVALTTEDELADLNNVVIFPIGSGQNTAIPKKKTK